MVDRTAGAAGTGAAAQALNDEEEDDVQYRQATPRERQFGYGSPSQRSSAGGEPVELPISQLHIVAAQRQLPLLMEAAAGSVDMSDVVRSWAELLLACKDQAPQILKYWHTGVGPLLRLATAVPRDQWLRSPKELWATNLQPSVVTALGLEDRLSRATSKSKTELLEEASDEYVEGPAEGAEVLPWLKALAEHLLCNHEVPGAVARGFTWSDGAGGMLRERPGREVILCSGIGLQMCIRFIQLYAAIGRGEEKPVDLAKELLTPGLTKKMVRYLLVGKSDFPPHPPVEVPDAARHVQPESVTLAGPLAAIRTAQVTALGGSGDLAQTVVRGTRLGKDLLTPVEEEFAETVLGWACRFADAPELADERDMSMALEWLLNQRDVDSTFSVVVAGNPRAPKKVLESARLAAASLELQRLQTSGQRFLRNPVGLKGFIKTGVVAAFGSPFEPFEESQPEWLNMSGMRASSPSENIPNSWHGDEYERSPAEEAFLVDKSRLRRATVRIDEIMSFEYMQHVGQVMSNCLRVEKRGGASLMKYLSRARSRESSFWVMTLNAEADMGKDKEDTGAGAPVQHLLLLEVYNDMRVIHQAEGPHPRRWPRPDAWLWLKEWAEREGLIPDGPEGVTVGPYGNYHGGLDRWDIRRCFLW